MHRAFGGRVAFLATIASVVMACVGDDPEPTGRQPDPSVPVGQEGGACTADKKCIAGLECVRGIICLPPEDGGAGGLDGGRDASMADATEPLECPFSGASGTDVSCGSTVCTSPSDAFCCLSSSSASCVSTCSSGTDKAFKCDSRADCASEPCCLRLASPLVFSTCPHAIGFAQVIDALCLPCTGTNEYVVCASDAECPTPQKCSFAEIRNDDESAKIARGVCR